MKVEQACRFRTTEGYGITARSAGINQDQEKVLAEVFNDSMSPFFPKLGTSILSCAVRGPYAFYSKNTLRAHETRKTIFTHSYIMAVEDYAHIMRTMPQCLLAVPASVLMDIQTGGENLESVDFPGTGYGELSIDELFQKYHLTAERYSRLLMGAYEAMTTNRSLRLYTSAALEDREQVVRELTYCIIEGLLPVLRGAVTFSSGEDTRMNFSILPAESSIRGGDLVFGVEDDRYTNIRFRDELSAACFRALGNSSHDQRRDLLQKMESWLREFTDAEKDLSLMLICISYIYGSGVTLTHDLSLSLFRSISKVTGKALSLKSGNALLTDLVENVVKQNMVSTNFLSNIAEWYLMESTETFRRWADKALVQASEEICVALVEAVIALPANGNTRELICVLVAKIPADSPELTEDMRVQLIHWIIREDVHELVDFCDAVMKSYTMVQSVALAKQILGYASQRKFNSAELAVVARTLGLMSGQRDAEKVFSLEDYALLDQHLEEFAGNLMTGLAENLLNVRIYMYSQTAEQVRLLLGLGGKNAELRTELEKLLQQSPKGSHQALLWENYLVSILFGKDITSGQVAEICRKYNTFLNTEGAFERQAKSCWARDVRRQLEAAARQEEGIRKADEAAVQLLKDAERLKMSGESRENLKRFVLNEFWGQVNYDNILKSKLIVSYELRGSSVPNAAFMYPLMTACGRVLSRPESAESVQELLDLVMYMAPTKRDRTRSQQVIYSLAYRVAKERGFLSWDLLLLSCWRGEEESAGGEDYDLEMLGRLALEIEARLRKHRINIRYNSATASILLRDKKLRKAVRRDLSQESRLAAKLVEDLKNSAGSAPAWGYQGAFSTERQRSTPPKTQARTESAGKPSNESWPARTPKGANPLAEEQTEEKKGFLSKIGFKGK